VLLFTKVETIAPQDGGPDNDERIEREGAQSNHVRGTSVMQIHDKEMPDTPQQSSLPNSVYPSVYPTVT
jgi:hypothetical protein